MVYTVPPPQMSGMIGSSPRDSAINSMNQRSDLLSSLVNASGGRRIRRKNKKKKEENNINKTQNIYKCSRVI